MDTANRQPVIIGLVAFVIGFAIGLFVFGWWLTPVEYTGAGPQHLLESDQNIYLRSLARLYQVDPASQPVVVDALDQWPEAPQEICALANEVRGTDPVQAQSLENLAALLNNNQGCVGVTTPAAEEEGGGLGTFVIVLFLLLLLALLVAAFFYVTRRPRADAAEAPAYPASMDMAGPATLEDSDELVAATPIARFETTYERGHDSYDDSFSIENEQGDFLGECGVGISESIGMDTPKNVTAFEVWLFDKNDIRTVTKVVMSDHAFFDEAIKAKLAPKGEPVLAREGETIVLETATLIINAEITEMDYGSGALPPKSFFERFTVELSAWAKEGDFDEPDIQGHIDEMLDY